MVRSAHLVSALAVVLVATLAFAGSAAAAAPKMEFAVQDDASVVGKPWMSDADIAAKRALTLQRARELGATHMRIVVYWHHMSERNPQSTRLLQLYKNAIIASRAAGLSVQVTFTGVAAPWGCPDVCLVSDTNTYVAPGGRDRFGMLLNRPLGANPKPAAFAAFVAFGIQQFHPLGVRRYSLGNEPNHGSFLCSGSMVYSAGKWNCRTVHKSARLYRRLYKASYRAAEMTLAANRWPRGNVQLLIGELTSGGEITGANPRSFMRKMTRPGLPIYADGFALHPYQFSNNPNDRCDQIRRPARGLGISCLGVAKTNLADLARANRLRRPGGSTRPVPLYLTEYGLFSVGRRKLSGGARAAWTRAAFDVAKDEGARQMLVYHMFSVPGAGWNTPVVSADNRPLEVFHALRSWADRNEFEVEPVSTS